MIVFISHIYNFIFHKCDYIVIAIFISQLTLFSCNFISCNHDIISQCDLTNIETFQ